MILVLLAGGELFVAGPSVVSLGTNAPEVCMRLLAAIQGRDEVDLAASTLLGCTIPVMLPLLQTFLVE